MSKMALAGDVTFADNGGKQMHPYVFALVRWCVSCLWSAATVLLHRVLTTPQVPSITASKHQTCKHQGRAASTGHIHPEPLVWCEVLHQPANREVDFVFVHGLYGSLENTWRQGDWRSKYKIEPNKIPLRRPSSIPDTCNSKDCVCNSTKRTTTYRQADINSCICVPNLDIKTRDAGFEDVNRNVNSLEVQVDFVKKLFETETSERNNNCDVDSDILDDTETCDVFDKCVNENSDVTKDNYTEYSENINQKLNTQNEIEKTIHEEQQKNTNRTFTDSSKAFDHVTHSNLQTKTQEDGSKKSCDVGCGCICDQCYSSCWPKDWLSKDFPNARIISINYTSDPYLWRPLWVKECKRLRLHERAEQMTSQLIDLGVGDKPVVWVGHSKGGLFIKQIYAEAYEAHLRINELNAKQNSTDDNSAEIIKETNNNKTNVNTNQTCRNYDTKDDRGTNELDYIKNAIKEEMTTHNMNGIADNVSNENIIINKSTVDDSDLVRIENEKTDSEHLEITRPSSETDNVNEFNLPIGLIINGKDGICAETTSFARKEITEIDQESTETNKENITTNIILTPIATNKNTETENVYNSDETNEAIAIENEKTSKANTEDIEKLARVANLWSKTAGFMFYSVPHRGSPLADIKTPLTARSVELLEISKDCSLVLTLQDRWIRAARLRQPAVRSLVETSRTLMALLWLRIVSVESADAGIGALCGVSVDHREICKPSSRCCVLYTELLKLIHAGLDGLKD